MPAPQRTGVVVYRARRGIDAIDEYSRRLVGAISACGVESRYVPDGPSSILARDPRPSWILLQYNPFGYGRGGIAPGLLRDVRDLRRRSGAPLAVMVHEAWVDMTDARSGALGLWQRVQLRALLRLADGVLTSTESLAREIGHGAVHVPVAANIEPIDTSHEAARARLGLDGKLAIAVFGRANPSRALDHAREAIVALANAHGADRVAVLNLGAGAPALQVPAGVEVRRPGCLPADELSIALWASDLVLLPFTDGVSTRRGTLMSALAHGRPVLALSGHNTDEVLGRAAGALALTPAGDRRSFARAAAELVADRARLRRLGDAGRRLYESEFDWPVAARRVVAVLGSLARRDQPRRIVFVAHDVGGPGGMERQSEQLVGRLLDAGHPVTVVARTCALADRKNLRFVRVPTPRRPASLGYPAFFAVASLLVAARGEGLLHTTGAIVANRADVSTIHYCHRAARSRVAGSRASRPDFFYRLNSRVNGVLSLAGERWCYRPARTGLLCAVSAGVAAELGEEFPAMRRSIRAVPNGVDAGVFRPDPVARRAGRVKLGLQDADMLSVFAGGDWERKGLAHAVDALALAPGWHLAVAGHGDSAPHLARARGAGTASRLHFLGRVSDMPQLYAAGDAFVFPTAYEAFPLVALEAAASGLALLVTHVNGVDELLHDGSNGWFIAQDAGDIAARLNQLHADPGSARRMALAARGAVTRYSWEAMAHAYLSIYAELK